LPCAAAAALFLAGVGASATTMAEELSLLGGWTGTEDHTSASYAWGLEYRQRLLAHLDASFGYLNEGHLPGHHRDGEMLQLWADTGLWRDRFALSFGAGPYVYFDTQFHYNFQGYLNQHGVGVILTGRVMYSPSRRWFALLEANQVVVTGAATRAVMLGAGMHVDSFIAGLERTPQSDQTTAVSDGSNELGFFGGQTTLNNLSSNKSTDLGVEYRRCAARHLEFSASLIEEGDGAVGRHAGIAGQVWVVQEFLARQLEVGLGVGPYAALSAYQTADGRAGASVVGLASMTVSWRFARSLALRFNWYREFTGDDQDRDIVTLGLGWRF
jgi:hypothetical protein